ncbi:MAG: aldose 1-epimerase family protein [Treponema sp.]|jgi:hypothetical protein|nr:aldose 1-epimerase family protein [Treponema sp.]
MSNSAQIKRNWQDILRHVGCIDQLAGVRRLTYTSGRRDGIRGYEVYNATGLHFNVMESRCLDIFNLWYKGTPFAFVSKPGMVSAQFADTHGVNFLRSAGAGLLYTCGLTNAGGEYKDDNTYDVFHGRIRFIPPENCGCKEEFLDDDFVLTVHGEMRDARLFGENLLLSREIKTSINSKSIQINDVIENRGFEEQEFMFLYHLNAGYPIVDEGCKLFIPSASISPNNDAAKKQLDQWGTVTAPVDGAIENVFTHNLMRDEKDQVHAGVYNEKLALGIAYVFSYSALEYIVEWRSMGSGDYVLGILASNNHCAGRSFERSNGTIKHIKPFERKKLGVTITILDGEKDLLEFREQFNRCTIKG